MTDLTCMKIGEFTNAPSFDKVPEIILNMQEEDSVSELVSFKNCFRLLRNLAAHEPSTLIAMLQYAKDAGFNRISFTAECGKDISVDITTFFLWLLDAGVKTNNAYYIVFAMTLFQLMYGNHNVFRFPSSIDYREDKVSVLLQLQGVWYQENKRLRLFNPNDEYHLGMLQNNRKLFWRLAIPDTFDFLGSVLAKEREESLYKFVLRVFEERENGVPTYGV